uniref:C2H2-type domain-containing protein n=1 Tax=Oryza glumipatula TaxID=40148 RepID=A0A0E0ACM8_9ORYZ
MEFRFRAGDRRHRPPSAASGPFSDTRRGYFVGAAQAMRGSATPRAGAVGHFRGGLRPPPPPPTPFGWEEAARLERIISEEVGRRLIEKEVERRLIEEDVRREVAFAHGLHVLPHDPFPRPPPPPPEMPVGMHPHPHEPPPRFQELGAWEGFRPRRQHAGVAAPLRFGQRMLLGGAERRWSPPPPPRPKPKHKLVLREIEPGESSEVPSETKHSEAKPLETKPLQTKVSGVKRKVDAIPATTRPGKLQKPAQDWSCALCQVSATSEGALNEHLEGKRHKAKLAHCGASNAIKDGKSSLKEKTANKDDAGPSDAPKKICIQVDGAMHEVVQKSNYLWCDRCEVRCDNNVTMADHLRGKKHSGLNKVWTSINAVRMNKKKEQSAATWEETVNENERTEIPVEAKDDSAGLSTEEDETCHYEIPVKNSKNEGTYLATEVDQSDSEIETPVEIMREGLNMATDATDENVRMEDPLKIKKENPDETNLAPKEEQH